MSTGDTLYALGHELVDSGRASDALSVFRTMLLVVPDDERGYLGLGLAHEALADTDAALSLYALAQTYRGSVRSAVLRARLLRRIGRDGDADRVLAEAADLATTEEEERLLGAAS